MKIRTCLTAFSLALVATVAMAQAPPTVTAGPEHDLLKADVGTWDATVEVATAPGQPMAQSKGVETNTLVGALWLVTDFKSEMMGAPFQGHGVSGWDTNKKKYVGTWVDTMSTGIGLSEATWDAATKTMSGSIEAPDATGAIQKMKSTVAYPDPDTRVFTMSSPGPDGKDMPMMRITYKRRK